jgi:hypothetical protein
MKHAFWYGIVLTAILLGASGCPDPVSQAGPTPMPSPTPTPGAFKFVNSWGKGNGWENVADGHYWVTYKTVKRQNMMIYYYYNDSSHVYIPTVLAVFRITHPKREECLVTLGLGNPASPFMTKYFGASSSQAFGGPLPFPSNSLALDISEFAQYINDYDLFLQVKNINTNSGTLDSFQVEFYTNDDTGPFKTITGSTGAIPGSVNGTLTATAVTHASLSAGEVTSIQPLTRSDIFGNRFVEEKPSQAELLADMAIGGVDKGTRNYNVKSGQFGTGVRPPTAEEWASMKKLRAFQPSTAMRTLPDSVDNSATQYFPPVGNQGNKGACVAFAEGYYVHTYNEAKEHGWNLSSTTWSGNPGALTSDLDKVFSPDFLYNQGNWGNDNGRAFSVAIALLTNEGCCSWQKMPYNVLDWKSWPSEDAFREAPRYRGRLPGSSEGYGYFIVQTDADINLMKTLLAAGYCMTTAILADQSRNTGLFSLFDAKDVADDDTAAIMTTNHAQTIVGYKEGTSWNKADPEN